MGESAWGEPRPEPTAEVRETRPRQDHHEGHPGKQRTDPVSGLTEHTTVCALPIAVLSPTGQRWIDYQDGLDNASPRRISGGVGRSNPLPAPIPDSAAGAPARIGIGDAREDSSNSAHLHRIEPWATEDGFTVLECSTCGAQW